MSGDTLRIFIASSSELEQDRTAFRELLSVENDRLHYKGVYLELVQWENFANAVSQNSKQDDYNESLKTCDIVICLFFTKAGKYTQQEFDTALKQFNETNAPLIYTYFKEPDDAAAVSNQPAADPAEEQCRQDLISFKKKLADIGHFYTVYRNIDNLKLQFLQQLDLLKDTGFEKLQEEIKAETKEAVTNYINNINTAEVLGNNNIVIQGVTDSKITINVNGRSEEMENKIDAMYAMFQKLGVNSFQADNKVYDVNGITDANFAFVMGRARQDKGLPGVLKNNPLSEEDDFWIKSLQQALDDMSVETDERPETIFNYFGWLVEAYLLKFLAIQEEGPPLRKLSFLTEAYQSSLRFLCFVQLSQIFQLSNKPQHPAINEFIRLRKEKQVSFDFSNLLIISTDMLEASVSFMPELKIFVKELSDTKSDLYSTNLFLEDIRDKVINKTIPGDTQLSTLIDEYLTALVEWLSKLAFISQYKMVSIKDIKLDYRLGTDLKFQHTYGELNGVFGATPGVEIKSASISIKGVYTFNQSVLLLKGQNIATSLTKIGEKDSYISLSPLIIDQSVYTEDLKQTPEIYFYTGLDVSNKLYNYSHFRNELPIGDSEITTNKDIPVRKVNKQAALNTLYKCLDDLLEPFKSNDK